MPRPPLTANGDDPDDPGSPASSYGPPAPSILPLRQERWEQMDQGGVELLFQEVFTQTSTGDFGLQVKNGPLLRCHSFAFAQIPGLLDQLRKTLKPLPIVIDMEPVVCKRWMKKKGLDRLAGKSVLKRKGLDRLADGIDYNSFSEDLHSPRHHKTRLGGYTTADPTSGTYGAFQVKDPLRLAEKWEISEGAELVVELVRFVYTGSIDWFTMQPTTDLAKRQLLHNMVQMLFLANKLGIDTLFSRLMNWFPNRAQKTVGDRLFCDAYYKIEYYWRNTVDEPVFRNEMLSALLDMSIHRQQLLLVSWDERWSGLGTQLLSILLDDDRLQIVNEAELLILIERWNCNRDKESDDLKILCQAYRQTPDNLDQLILFLSNSGLLNVNASSPDKQVTAEQVRLETVRALFKILKPNIRPVRQKKDSKKKNQMNQNVNDSAKKGSSSFQDDNMNMSGAPDSQLALMESQQQLANQNQNFPNQNSGVSTVADPKGQGHHDDDHDPDHFVMIQKKKDSKEYVMKSKGLSFTLEPHSTLTQLVPIACAQKIAALWQPAHSFFIGCIYNGTCFSGYLGSASPYLGLYEIRCVSGVSSKPEKAFYISGSGNKIEFDFDFVVEMCRINEIVDCQMGVMSHGYSYSKDTFQISKKCLDRGGLRFQFVPVGLNVMEQIDLRFSWIVGAGKVQN